MDFVINYEYLMGTHNETVIRELSIAGENFVETFQFQIPYVMRCQGDTETGLNWDDGHIPYNELSTVLSEAVAGFAHLYVYGVSKCVLLSQMLGRPVHNLDDWWCPSPRNFRNIYSCTKQCHRNPSFCCATRHAHSLYEWLMLHLQKVCNITCPQDKKRHTARFVSAV